MVGRMIIKKMVGPSQHRYMTLETVDPLSDDHTLSILAPA